MHDRHLRAGLAIRCRNSGAKLLGKGIDNTGAEARRALSIPSRNANPVVLDVECPSAAFCSVIDRNRSGLVLAWKGVLEGVDDELGDDKAEADGHVGGRLAVICG
jgi:hypothetical protein